MHHMVDERTISFAGMSPVVLRQSKLGRMEKVRHGLPDGGRKTKGAFPPVAVMIAIIALISRLTPGT